MRSMNNTEIPAMFLKLNGKWGYDMSKWNEN